MGDDSVAAALLPDRRTLYGPVTRRRLARLSLVYAGVFALGLALAYGAGDPRWQTFGLGLIVPGGGFFAYADATTHGVIHLATGLVSLGVVGFGVSLWFATGNVIAPPALWLLTAALAALMDHGDVAHRDAVPSGVGLIAVALLITAAVRRFAGGSRRGAANRYLQHAALPATPNPQSLRQFGETERHLMRFVLDRALQPIEAFDGFEWLDQFQTAAVRYQINFMGYALSMAQAAGLPTPGADLEEAQRRLIEKQTEHRVWRYWALENLWGNLRRDPDPVKRENIMFTGFVAVQMAMYQAASGRRDFDAPGSFTLRHPDGRSYRYDLGALVAALDREQRRSDFALIACEPNWIYPLCNTIGAAAMLTHDRTSGQDRWPQLAPRFREAFEQEFVDLAGNIAPCRSNYTGVAFPMLGGAQPQAMPCFFLNATFPDLALRQWLLLRRRIFVNGALVRARFWRVDTGNYRFSRAAAYAGTALAAVELGDRDVARACLDALDEECPMAEQGGAHYRPDASVWAHAVELLARCDEEGGFRRLMNSPRGAVSD